MVSQVALQGWQKAATHTSLIDQEHRSRGKQKVVLNTTFRYGHEKLRKIQPIWSYTFSSSYVHAKGKLNKKALFQPNAWPDISHYLVATSESATPAQFVSSHPYSYNQI